jgi:Ca2+-binding RTX toxin-like protein
LVHCLAVHQWTFIMPIQNFFKQLSRNRARVRRHSRSGQSPQTSPNRHAEILEHRLLLTANANGDDLRTYRLAVSATEEYTAFFGNDRNAAQDAIVATVNNLNEIFRRELNLQMELIMDLSIVFGPGNSPDPFNSSVSSTLLDQNHTLLDSAIGSANYDIGHVFGTFNGGLATIESAGMAGFKGEGASGTSTPTGTDFELLSAHEFAHQFGGTHSFNGVEGFCNERNATTAFEPGSGSTILSYGGICPAAFVEPPTGDNLVNDPDAYFHAGSIDQMVTFLESLDGMSVGTISPNVNQIPTADAGNDFTIPARTPFQLSTSGSDGDGDTLLYTIEQTDLGVAQTVNPAASAAARADNGSSPLFRSFEPAVADASGSFTRVFPQLSDILTGTQSKGEQLPTTNRALNFRASARDQQGGINGDDVTLTVIDTGSSFSITNLNSTTTLTGGDNQTLTWDVAGTTANGINVANVDILFSTDGGLTFPTVLATTSNDGSHTLALPNIDTTTARFQLRSVGNIFFDINDADITLAPNPSAPGVTITQTDGGTAVGEVAAIGPATDTYTIGLNTTPSSAVQVTISGGDELLVSVNGLGFSATQTLSLSDTTLQTVTLRALNDADVEGIHFGTVTHAVTNSSDGTYPVGLLINNLTVTITDDERPPLIGVDLQTSGETVPLNWTEINENDSVFSATTFSDLIREDGTSTSIDLRVGPPSSQGITFGSSDPDESTVPIHSPNLVDAGGVLGWTKASNNIVNATWQDLTPGALYNIYVLVAERFGGTDINHTVTITGAGTDDPAPFAQTTSGSGGELRVNDQQGDDAQTLESFALPVTSDGSGEINIQFARNDGASSNVIYLGGLAIQQAITPSAEASNVTFNAVTGELTVNLTGGQAAAVTAAGGPSGNVVVTIDSAPATFDSVTPASVQSIVINGSSAADTIDVSAVSASDFTNASGVAVTVNADAGNDIVTGSAFANLINGGDGDDQLTGGSANDTIDGDDGNDAIDGLAGDDVLTGDLGDDALTGGAGTLDRIVETADANLTLTDTSLTGIGTDVISGIEAATLVGGLSSNTLDASGFSGSGGTFIDGAGGGDILFGSAGLDVLTSTGNGDDSMEGNAGDDFVFPGSGRDTIRGGAGNDRLFGQGGSGDQLFGGEGDDNLDGGSGNDSLLSGEAGNDKVFGGSGNDVLDGGTGRDTVFGDSGDDVIQGGDGNDLLSGGAGVDVLDGGGNTDRVSEEADTDFTVTGLTIQSAATGNDTPVNVEVLILSGGVGNNSIDVSAASIAVIVAGRAGNDTITGSAFNDSLFGEDGDDVINGGAGSDLLDGGLGNDDLDGGADDDVLTGGLGDDNVDGGAGALDQLNETGDVNLTLTTTTLTGLGTDSLANIEAAFLFGGLSPNVINASGFNGGAISFFDGAGGGDTIIGSPGPDILTSSAAGDDSLDGGDGADSVFSGSGRDTLLGGGGDDILKGQGGSGDVLRGGDGNDRLDGGTGNDPELDGGEGDDLIFGDNGNDVLIGGAGKDTLFGGAGDDQLFGQSGGDLLSGQGGTDVIDGGSATDRFTETADTDFTLIGSNLQSAVTGNETLTSIEVVFLIGGPGNNRIDASGATVSVVALGEDGDDTIGGGLGNDTLDGGIGNDIINGGLGNDVLTGGTGDDGLSGFRGDDFLVGGDGDDLLVGHDGSDTINGDAGQDTLVGGGGTSVDGDGVDTLTGGDGPDQLDGDPSEFVAEMNDTVAAFTNFPTWVDAI